MKFLFTILFSCILLSASSQTLVGYMKNSGSFTNTAALNISPCNVDVYITGKQFGQVGMGDVIKNAGGTPINGGSTWWGYSRTNGGTSSYRGYKIDGSGVVVDVIYNSSIIGGPDLIPVAFHNNSGIFDCGGSGFTFTIYGPTDDPGIYNGKVVCNDPTGSPLAATNYTASYASGGLSFWTFTASGFPRVASSVTCCSGTPVANAGSDFSVSLPSPTINLTGFGIDCDGSIASYLWSNFSGPNIPTINNATFANASVVGVIAGTYVFKLTVTDNLGNTGIDFVQVTVVSAPLCSPCTVVNLLPRGCWNLTGSAGFGGQRMNDTITKRMPSIFGTGWPLFDHDVTTDPRHGNFDFNSTQAGVNPDTTSIIMPRSIIHAGNTANGQTYFDYFHLGNGNQQVFLVDAERPVDFDALYIKTNGVAVTNAFEYIITDDPLEVRRAVFQYTGKYGSPTITGTVSLTNSATSWDSVINIRSTGRFLIIRTNPNDGNSPKQGPGIYSIIPYGADHPGAFTRSSITPNWSAIYPSDTTYPVIDHSGKVIASAGPTSNFPYSRMFGGYLNPIDTTAANGGQGDTTNKVWVQGTAGSVIDASFKLYLPQYGDNNLFNPANRGSQELEAYMAVTNNNRYLLKQLYNLNVPVTHPSINNQHIPIDHLGMDIRDQTAFGRYAWYWNFLYAVLNHYTPNPASPYYAYIPLSRVVGWWSGGSTYANGVKEWMPPGNEENMDFRPGDINQSSWLPPVSFYKIHDTIFKIFKSLFQSIHPDAKFVMQGLASNDFNYLFVAEMLGKIENVDWTYTMCDIVNWHGVTILNMTDIDGGCAGNINQQSVFGGYRLTGQYIQDMLDSLAIFSGRRRPGFQTEYAVASSLNWQLPVTGCDFNILSVPHIANRPTYRPYDQQGYLKLDHQITINERGKGIMRSWQYEGYDLTDTVGGPGDGSHYYNNNDGSDGDRNIGSNFIKPGYYISQEHDLWLGNYRVVAVQSDSVNGQYRALYRKVLPVKTDSFCTLPKWGAWTDPTGPRTIFLGSDVTTVLHRRHSYPDATYAGTTTGLTVTSGSVSLPLTFEPDYIFFKSPATAATFDNQPPVADAGVDQAITLPVNFVSLSASASFDPDGTITTYSWSKISGPSTYTIGSPAAAATLVSSLVQGTYVFQITVTDNGGASTSDQVTITVNPAPPVFPTIIINRRYIITNH